MDRGVENTPKKKRKKPVRKVPRTKLDSDVKSSAPLSDFEGNGVRESRKLWVSRASDMDRNNPVFVFLARGETKAKEFAEKAGVGFSTLDSIERRGAYILSMGERQSDDGNVEMKDKESDDLTFWVSTDHATLYPYSPGTVVAAKNKLDATKLLTVKLQDLGLQEPSSFSMRELGEEEGYQIATELSL